MVGEPGDLFSLDLLAEGDESKDPKTAHLTLLFEAERWGAKPGKADLIIRLDDSAVPVLRIPISVILPEQKGNSS